MSLGREDADEGAKRSLERLPLVPGHPTESVGELGVRSALEARKEPGPFRGKLEKNGATIGRIGPAANVSKTNESVAQR